MSSSTKIWVQPVGNLWVIKHQGQVLFRTRTQEEGIEEAKSLIPQILYKFLDEDKIDIVVETKEGLIKSIIVNRDEISKSQPD